MRFSQPMMRSRLRRPTSKSITTVLYPLKAKPAAKDALVVVLPTPPLPEVTTTIFATMDYSYSYVMQIAILKNDQTEFTFFWLKLLGCRVAYSKLK